MVKKLETIKQKLTEKKLRLAAYYERERELLSKKGIKSYGIGSQNVTRYDTSLKEIQDAIKSLEREVTDLETMSLGHKPCRAVAVVPQDW